jgi:hypothetical protein
MKTAILAGAGALAMVHAIAPAANADDLACQFSIAGSGRSHIAETREDIGPSRLGVTAHELARRRAVESWKAKVSLYCPRYSTSYWRARDKAFDCEAGAGNRQCVFTARPSRKILG